MLAGDAWVMAIGGGVTTIVTDGLRGVLRPL